MSDQNNHVNPSPNPERRTTKRKKKKGGRVKRFFVRFFQIVGTLFLIGITTAALICCFFAVYLQTAIIPNASIELDDFFVGENSVMYYHDAATGTEQQLVTLLSSTNSVWVDYEEIPKYLLDATVAIEDKRFYQHNGVDWIRTSRAILSFATGVDIQGGSTITQQLIKNLTQDDDVTVKRKVIEIFRALSFDNNFSKDTTLTWYLNIIFLGENCKGIGSASYEYFGKPVSELTLAECASLIAITNNPSIFSPYGTLRVVDEETGEITTSKDYNKQRQELILKLMLEQEKITQQEFDQAIAQELVFVRSEGETDQADIYSWYEETVISDVRRDLMEQYGYSSEAANMLLASGGLHIYTCVVPEIQAIAESVYENRENLDYTSPSGEQKLQSAITIIDNSTGDIVAIVGRVGEKTINLGTNFATDTQRQPGSTIKPLAVYAPALDMQLITPYSTIDDYPYQVLGGNAWPSNVDGRYRGLVTVSQALTNSYNTTAVRILADYVTAPKSFDYMENKFHVNLVDAEQINGQIHSDMDTAPLALGGLTRGVTTREMANAYSVFPNQGTYRYARTYTQVFNSKGELILDNTSEPEQAISQTAAYYMNTMLKNVVANGTGRAAALSNMTVAGKTGTTDSMYDLWFVGYTPYYTAAVWTGYDAYNERIVPNGSQATGMWNKVMSQVHEGLANKDFTPAASTVSIQYCLDSGMKAVEGCHLDPRGSRVASATMVQGTAPTEYCTMHSAESAVTVCLDCPVLTDSEEPTGLYHIAGEFCPEESHRQVTLLNYDRLSVGNARAEDSRYLYVYVDDLGPCTTHTEKEPDEDDSEGEDPLDPSNPDGSNPSGPWMPGFPSDPDEPNPDGSDGLTDPDEPDPDGSDGPTETDPYINPETGRPYGY